MDNIKLTYHQLKARASMRARIGIATVRDVLRAASRNGAPAQIALRLATCAAIIGYVVLAQFVAGAPVGGAQAAQSARGVAAPLSVPVASTEDVATFLSLGANFSCAVLNTGALKCWGSNSRWQLTESTVAVVAVSPVAMPAPLNSGVSRVAVGDFYGCAIVSGTVHCWGAGLYGQIGNNPVQNPYPGALAGVEGQPAVLEISTTMKSPVTVTLGGSATDVAVGDYHTCAVVGGAVKCWGRNFNGELGDGSSTHRASPVAVSGIADATAVAAGDNHTCAIVTGGAVKCWGNNRFGQLGNGTNSDSSTPVTAGSLTGVTALALGGSHTCALSGTAVYCWGLNDLGQLGLGNTSDANAPQLVSGLSATSISAGEYFTCASSGGGAKCWGRNNHGQLGDNTFSNRSSPTNVVNTAATGALAGVTAVYAGEYHACAAIGGDVKCWGRNQFGQLGDGTGLNRLAPSTVVGFGTPEAPASTAATGTPTSIPVPGSLGVAAGRFHSCNLKDGVVKCWGANGNGQLGDGTLITRTTPMPVLSLTDAVRIAAGGDMNCVITTVGQAKCWGEGASNRIYDGDGSADPRTSPATILGVGYAVDVGVGQVYHQCVQQNDGEIRCWGQAIKGGEIGDSWGDVRQSPSMVSGITNVSRFGASGFHSCAIVQRGAVKCWGSNDRGQIGDGTYTETGNVLLPATPSCAQRTAVCHNRYTPTFVKGITGAVAIEMGFFHTCALLNTGKVMCWGYNQYGQIGNGQVNQQVAANPVEVAGLPPIQSLAIGNSHTCAVTTAGDVYCWGRGDAGQMGNFGLTQNNPAPVQVLGLSNVSAVAAGQDHSCVILNTGSTVCWGDNRAGQLAANPTTVAMMLTAFPPTATPQPANSATAAVHQTAIARALTRTPTPRMFAPVGIIVDTGYPLPVTPPGYTPPPTTEPTATTTPANPATATAQSHIATIVAGGRKVYLPLTRR
jgi:alpha-tubulin suppressor-like RCC1 family protein